MKSFAVAWGKRRVVGMLTLGILGMVRVSGHRVKGGVDGSLDVVPQISREDVRGRLRVGAPQVIRPGAAQVRSRCRTGRLVSEGGPRW